MLFTLGMLLLLLETKSLHHKHPVATSQRHRRHRGLLAGLCDLMHLHALLADQHFALIDLSRPLLELYLNSRRNHRLQKRDVATYLLVDERGAMQASTRLPRAPQEQR